MKYFLSILIVYFAIIQNEAKECDTNKSPDSPKIYYLHVKSDIKYRYATTTVVSRVANPANNSQEVFFFMNLPESAFITSFVLEIDGKEYNAYIKEKEEAKQIYDHAVSSGASAGLVAVASRDSNHFKISVNVEATGKVKFTLKYEELLQRKLGTYSQVINLNPGQVVNDLKVEVHISEPSEIKKLFVPELKVTNEIETDEKENKNVVITQPEKNKAIVTYTPSEEEQEKVGGKCFDGQFIVNYDVDRVQSCGQILVKDGYFVHFYAPEGLSPLRKLVVFVLDLSGSMYGNKLVQLKEAMSTILEELDENDYFSIVDFSYSVTVHNLDSPIGSVVISPDSWYREPETEAKLPSSLDVQQAYPATKDYVNKAKQVIAKMFAGGGTNIADSLKTAVKVSQKALEKIRNETNDKTNFRMEPLILFLTDGEPTVGVTNLKSIQSMVNELNDPKTSIFSLGFGYGADIKFLKKLSLENAGFARTIYEASDAALQLRHFYKQISSPLLSNVTFTYLSGKVDDNTLTKHNFHSLLGGSELVVAGKLANNDVNLQSDVHSTSANGTEQCTMENAMEVLEEESNEKIESPESPDILPVPQKKKDEKKEFGSLEKLWAYLSIKELIDKHDLLEQESKNAEEIKNKALNLALKYKFVTPFTSLVVVKPNQSQAVSNLDEQEVTDNPSYLATKFASVPLIVGGAPIGLAPMSVAVAAPPAFALAPGSIRLGIMSSNILSAPRTTGGPGNFAAGFAHRPVMNRYPGAQAAPGMMYATTTFVPHVDRMDAEYQEQDIAEPTVSNNLTLSDLEWLEQVLGNDNTTVSIPSGNSTHSYNLLTNPPNSTYQDCRIRLNEPGKCTHLVNCILPEFASNLQDFLTYFCLIPGDYVGVCCPEKSTSAITTTNIPETTTITASSN